MNRDFALVADSERRTRKGLVGDRAVSITEYAGCSSASPRTSIGCSGHGIRGQFQAEASLHVDARNCHRQMPAHGNLPEECARDRNLSYVADAECRQPRLCLRKALDQIRAAEAEGNHRLAAL